MKGATSNIEFLDGNMLKTIDLDKTAANRINVFLRPHYKDNGIEPIVAHEIKALKRLAEYDMVPTIKGYSKTFIEMSYVGEDIKGNLSIEQIDYVINALHKAGITHNDLACDGILRNCTCYKGKLYLIDFQLASIDGIPPVKDIYESFFRTDYGSDEKQLRLRETLT